MLWLTGLMGLLAVGAVSSFDMGSSSDNDEDTHDAAESLLQYGWYQLFRWFVGRFIRWLMV